MCRFCYFPILNCGLRNPTALDRGCSRFGLFTVNDEDGIQRFFLSPAQEICSRLPRFLPSEITTFTSIIEQRTWCIAVSKKNHEKNPQILKIAVFVTIKQYFIPLRATNVAKEA